MTQLAAALAHFFVAMAFDRLGLLFVKLSKLGSRVLVHAQEFIQFGMKARLSRRLVRWMNRVMMNTARVATAFHSKVAGLENSHSTA